MTWMQNDLEALPLPDWASLVVDRLANPRGMTADIDPEGMGEAILRQLVPNEGPGGKKVIRMSGLGKCIRAMFYDVMGYENTGRKIDGRTRATFAMGDMAEQLLMTALADVVEVEMEGGWWLDGFTAGEGQESVNLVAGGWHIPGHPDGMLESSYLQDKIVMECKSASSYSFKEWRKSLKEGRCPWTEAESYWWQIQGYMHATGANYGYVLALCKDSGAIMGFYVNKSDSFIPMLEKHLKLIDGAMMDESNLPPRQLADGAELGPVRKLSKRTGKPLKGDGMLAWQCRYCSHFRRCWGASLREEVVTDYRGMPSLGLFVQSDADADR